MEEGRLPRLVASDEAEPYRSAHHCDCYAAGLSEDQKGLEVHGEAQCHLATLLNALSV